MSAGKRLLIYSHDSFGLGHLRRCRAIANDLAERFESLSVLILSGSPIIGSFDFAPRVDFVRIPGVIKLRNGEYTSLKLRLDVEDTIGIRSSIIEHTAAVFEPDLFLVDKEPLGLRGEVRPTLQLLQRAGTHCVLGLRDVMDDPASLEEEWARKGVIPALDTLYDEIWVYGLPEIFDPISEIAGLEHLEGKIAYTGYIRRQSLPVSQGTLDYPLPDEPFILATTGGGGDGGDLIDWILRAYESDDRIETACVIVAGPFLDLDQRTEFQERASRLSKVRILTFDAHIERLYHHAVAVVAMGGYNTFCEILSFGKRAIVVPRTEPRVEQQLRAERAEKLGLLHVLSDEFIADASVMARALRELPTMLKPSPLACNRMLGGLDEIARLAAPRLGGARAGTELSRYA